MKNSCFRHIYSFLFFSNNNVSTFPKGHHHQIDKGGNFPTVFAFSVALKRHCCFKRLPNDDLWERIKRCFYWIIIRAENLNCSSVNISFRVEGWISFINKHTYCLVSPFQIFNCHSLLDFHRAIKLTHYIGR
jgi:hypothetical protein